jgi:hypothetical protein
MVSSRSAIDSWRRIRELRSDAWWVLLPALILLPMTALILRLVGFRRVYGTLDRVLPRPVADSLEGRCTTERALSLEHTVRAVARRAPFDPGCLATSVCLWTILRSEGIAAELQLGVRRSDLSIEAHAWVSCRGRRLEPWPESWAAFPPLPRVAGPAGGARP